LNRRRRVTLALAGNPNVGKSVIFNQLTGASQTVGNWPGKTVERAEGKLYFKGYEIVIIDLPGTYSLSAYSQEEIVARDYIAIEKPDIVVNIVDASALERNLYLTLQLLEMHAPLIIGLNLMDVARSKGIRIDVQKLWNILGVPVIPMVAVTGHGIDRLISTVVDIIEGKIKVQPLNVTYGREVERGISALEKAVSENLPELASKYSPRWIAIKLLERDEEIIRRVSSYSSGNLVLMVSEEIAGELEKVHGEPSPVIIASERYSLINRIISEVQVVESKEKVTLSEKLDYWTTHPIFGYIILLSVMAFIFSAVFLGGGLIEEFLSSIFDDYLIPWINDFCRSVLPEFYSDLIVNGILTGIVAGITIAIPYVFTFYILLAILEDSGYLPRAAFLMDNFMHRIGLHGKAFIPLILGYGCNVPACIGCRIMETDRERLILGFLIVLVPCAARTVVILGIVGKYLGLLAALSLYAFNLIVIILLGRLLNRSLPGEPIGLIMEMPDYRLPMLKPVLFKTWFRTRDFIYVAFPLIIAGSFVLELVRISGLIWAISDFASPFISGVLGLPKLTAIPLIFGILRKELTLIMLIELFKSSELNLFLTPIQMVVFSIITIFYIPCIATVAACLREYGLKRTLLISFASIFLAFLLGWTANLILTLLNFI